MRLLVPICLLIACAAMHHLYAGYTNLIPMADGSGVYVQAQSGFGPGPWYKVVAMPFGQWKAEAVSGGVEDTSRTATAISSSSGKWCGNTGSTCLLQPSCVASTRIEGTNANWSASGLSASIRLDSSGLYAWIETLGTCSGQLNSPRPTPLATGLYIPASLTRIATADGAKLATSRKGRRT